MPSPFPGMDPYLEAAKLWPDVHHSLISGIRQQLNPQLRPKYVARIEERVYISDETDAGRKAIIPDLHVVAAQGHATAATGVRQSSQVETAQAVEVVELIEQVIHEPRIEILDADTRNVVTVIEVLSPTNKIRGSEGRREYMKKRRNVIASPTNLVEIDLLRDGAPVFVGQELPPHEYGVYVSRALGDVRKGLFWPIRLSQKLPEIPIPLRSSDADVRLNLQSVLDSQYADAGYDVDIDYAKNPEIALPAVAAKWADDLLRAKGLR